VLGEVELLVVVVVFVGFVFGSDLTSSPLVINAISALIFDPLRL